MNVAEDSPNSKPKRSHKKKNVSIFVKEKIETRAAAAALSDLVLDPPIIPRAFPLADVARTILDHLMIVPESNEKRVYQVRLMSAEMRIPARRIYEAIDVFHGISLIKRTKEVKCSFTYSGMYGVRNMLRSKVEKLKGARIPLFRKAAFSSVDDDGVPKSKKSRKSERLARAVVICMELGLVPDKWRSVSTCDIFQSALEMAEGQGTFNSGRLAYDVRTVLTVAGLIHPYKHDKEQRYRYVSPIEKIPDEEVEEEQSGGSTQQQEQEDMEIDQQQVEEIVHPTVEPNVEPIVVDEEEPLAVLFPHQCEDAESENVQQDEGLDGYCNVDFEYIASGRDEQLDELTPWDLKHVSFDGITLGGIFSDEDIIMDNVHDIILP